MKRAVHIALATAVLALFMASVQSCIARRNEFALYPTRSNVQLPGTIRVWLNSGEACKIQVAGGGYKLIAAGKTIFADSSPLPEVTASAATNGIMIGRDFIGHRQAELVPEPGARLLVNNKPYRGLLRLINNPSSGLMAVNVVDLDDYVAGVVCCEMPSLWKIPALMAQAVAARTYALYRARTRASWSYDVCPTTGDQVYNGISGETSSGWEAVERTRGIVLLYDWKILPAYYHAVCGGHTASRKTVFGEEEITPLAGRECRFCNPSMHGLLGPKMEKYFRWEVTVQQADLASALALQGVNMPSIDAIVPVNIDAGGYAAAVDIRPKTGAPARMPVEKFRLAVGFSKLISPAFNCTKKGNAFVFTGKGYGHGVGMCQWGASGMARENYTSQAILEYYYPGAQVTKVY